MMGFKSRQFPWTVLILVLLVMTACNTVMPISTPTVQVIATRYTAILIGKLALVDNCLRVNESVGVSHLLAWSPDFEVSVEKNRVKIFDHLTGEKAEWQIGESVQLGGGEVPILDEQVRNRLLSNCIGPYWVVGIVIVSPTVTPGSR